MTTTHFDILTANLSGRTRREMLAGREYLVAPATMIVPGVLNGSNGPLLYTEGELKRNPSIWNNTPIVINHPRDDSGKYISARDPKILNKQGIGYVFESAFNGKSVAETWFDVERTRTMAPDILSNLEAGRPIELSTGLGYDLLEKPGVFNGVSYAGEAINHRPDHLAILPQGEGACAIKHGCGVLANQQTGILRWIANALGFTKDDEEIANELPDMTPEKACMILKDGTANGKPLTDSQKRMFGLICGKKTNNEEHPMGKLSDTDRKGLVDGLVSNCGCTGKRLFAENDRTYLMALPEERLQQFDADQKQIAANELILTNARKGIESGEHLIVINEKGQVELKTRQPDLVTVGNQQYKKDPTTGHLIPFTGNQQTVTVAPVAQNAAPITAEQWYSTAPPEIRSAVANAVMIQDQERVQLAASIAANANNPYPKEVLAKMTLEQLKPLAALAGRPQTQEPFAAAFNFAGMAGGATVTGNAAKLDQDDMLPLPSAMNWQEMAAGSKK